MSIPLLVAGILAVAIPLQLRRAHRPEQDLGERWARGHGVELTPENRALVTDYLRNASVLRTWGGVAGAVLPSVIAFAWSGRVQVLGFGTDGESAPLAFGTIFIGYLVGALCAEVALARPVAGTRRKASLSRRELEDYLPHRVILAQRSSAVAGALGMIAIGLVPYADSASNPGLPWLALAAAATLSFGAGLEAIERWVVRRPQPVTSLPLVAADDAIRVNSIHAVAGAGLALLLLLCSGVALGLQASDVAALNSTMVVPAAACFVLSLFAWRHVGQGSRRVRHPAATSDVAPA